MHTFFHGWRRKAGVVALAMAMFLWLAWMRSYTYSDFIGISRNHQLLLLLVSSRGEIWWETCQDSRDPPPSDPFWCGSYQHGLVPDLLPIEEENSEALPSVPYAYLTCPLTLLSAYLVLWKPRKRA